VAETVCGCRERRDAFKDGWFIYAPDRDGWIFTDGPIRERTRAALYYGPERGVDDHSGEPFVWQCCPFCGEDLPDQRHDMVWHDDQGDGAE
jgi:hypothetical protein